jgi:hypothetical protein
VLKSIDILIGLVVVLLTLSMAVTVITQTITTIVNSRGRHLRRGLTDLLQQLDPALTARVSKAVATRLLTHPLVSGSNTPMAGAVWQPDSGAWSRSLAGVRKVVGGPRLGNVVHREEFTKLLLYLASDDGAHALDPQAVATLKAAIERNGIPNTEAALKGIRTVALRLERSHPQLAHGARQNLAILQQAESDFVAKINNWFDQSMDRTSQRFTASTRAITFAGAFVVAFGLQVDTLSLANRFAADDNLRQAFVNQAVALDKTAQSSGQQAAVAIPPAGNAAAQYQSFLAQNGIIQLPGANFAEWKRGFEGVNYFGLLITALLLSLGAPFWYGVLGNLLQLRSVLAAKDDVQRGARQSTDPAAPVATPPLAGTGGDRGDMLTVG